MASIEGIVKLAPGDRYVVGLSGNIDLAIGAIVEGAMVDPNMGAAILDCDAIAFTSVDIVGDGQVLDDDVTDGIEAEAANDGGIGTQSQECLVGFGVDTVSQAAGVNRSLNLDHVRPCLGGVEVQVSGSSDRYCGTAGAAGTRRPPARSR